MRDGLVGHRLGNGAEGPVGQRAQGGWAIQAQGQAGDGRSSDAEGGMMAPEVTGEAARRGGVVDCRALLSPTGAGSAPPA